MKKIIRASGSSFPREMHGEIGREGAKEVLDKAEDVEYALSGIIKQARGSRDRYGSATGIGKACVDELYAVVQKYELI